MNVKCATIMTEVERFKIAEKMVNISETRLCIRITLYCLRLSTKEQPKRNGLYFRHCKTTDCWCVYIVLHHWNHLNHF